MKCRRHIDQRIRIKSDAMGINKVEIGIFDFILSIDGWSAI
jgi:hypothetical protein